MALKKLDAQTFETIMETAKAGSPDAQEKVGTMFLEGKGVAPDAAAAREWYEKAAKQGEPGAYYGLALINLEGNGVRKDKIEAYAYLLAMKSEEGLLKKRWDLSIAKRMLNAVSSLESKLSDEERDLGRRRAKALLRGQVAKF
jgi:TPR repeat protein